MDFLQLPIYVVDAFTNRPFAGNPAAVCLLSHDLADAQKQKIAAEMNLSETAFVLPLATPSHGSGSGSEAFGNSSRFRLQWFTPTTEVPLCGHATLATACVLFFKMGNRQKLHFETRHSGILTAELQSPADGAASFVRMLLPLNPPNLTVGAGAGAGGDAEAIWRLVSAAVGADNAAQRVQSVHLSPTTKKLLVRLKDDFSRQELESLSVQKDLLLNVGTGDRVRGIILTAKGSTDSPYDFISRYFAPWVGIPEDPVTGSAHTVSGPFWAGVLGRRSLFARQCSPRGGEVSLEVGRDGLGISGQGAVVLEGQFSCPK